MNTIGLCKQCRQPLPENAPEGLCPACLAKVALGSEPAAPGGTISINPLAGQAPPGTRVPPDVAQLAPQFPQLEIIELLGMGGMGMVYKARQPRLDRFVALKILPVESAQHPSFAERFNREAKALAKLNHPGIVDVYDFGQTGQYYYFIMEYVDGMNLRRLLNDQPVTPRQALDIVVQICTALQYAHDKGVVHRDIKPENILINKEGQVKIADFGLAKLLGTAPDTALTMSQAAMGTFNYMAPEQRENAQKVDHRADIYSLGVVFYEMLTGEVPMGRFEPPSKRVQVDVRLDEVVLRALEREPARRYQQVSEVKTGVEMITSTMPAPLAASLAAPSPAAPSPRFADWVVKPMTGFLLVWLATWFAQGWVHSLGLVLLFSVPPSLVFVWRYKLASLGLRWRQLPPAVRRRGHWRALAVMAACVAASFVAILFLPYRVSESREEAFVPHSHSCRAVALNGNICRLQVPAYGKRPLAAWGQFTLLVYRKDPPKWSGEPGLGFELPGLRVFYVPDAGQELSFGMLTNWLHENAQLDVAQPQVQNEALELMNLFSGYYTYAPMSWEQFSSSAKMHLQSFDSSGTNFSFTNLNKLYPIRLAALGCGFCLFYFVFLRSLKRTLAEGRAEIQAGRWAPPNEVPKRFPNVIKVLFAVGLIPLAFAVVAGFRGEIITMLVILLSLGAIVVVALQLHSRQQIQQARAKGLWPQLGEPPTLEHLRRLAQAGEIILAIKFYRQIYGVSLMDAKAAVEKLAGHSVPPLKAETPPVAAPPATPVSSQPRLSRTALAGAMWAPWFFLAVSAYFWPVIVQVKPDSAPHGPAGWQVMITLLPLGLTSPFGTTILGYVALSHIRHSAGRLYGLGLALFDALLFPLLLVDGLVFVLVTVIVSALVYWLPGPAPLNSALSPHLILLPAGLVSIVLDYFIVRKVWRFCRR